MGQHEDFRWLWTADTVSQAGTGVTLVAMPLVAVSTLHASAFQAALVVVSEYLAALLIGLPAGAWVDRARQRRVLLAGDLGRALLLLSVPAAAALHRLTLPQLYAVSFGLSVGTAFFDVAFQSCLARLIGGERLLTANVRLESTRNLVQAGGPGLGGAVVAVLSAPAALAVDALSFLLSALSVGRIRQPERDGDRADQAETPTLRSEIAEGLRFVFGDRLLRAITCSSAVSNMCGVVGSSMLMVLLAGRLHLAPWLCGLVFTVEAAGGLLGAWCVERFTARLGQGPAMVLTLAASSVLWLLAVPLYRADGWFLAALLLNGLGWVAFMTYKITGVSFRQRVCPPPLLGRMTATFRFVVWGLMPVGALLGGVLGQIWGPRAAMWAGAVGELFAVLPVLFSPVPSMRELPGAPADQVPRAETAVAATNVAATAQNLPAG